MVPIIWGYIGGFLASVIVTEVIVLCVPVVDDGLSMLIGLGCGGIFTALGPIVALVIIEGF